MIRQFLPGEFHGQRSLVGYSPCGYKESDMTEWLSPLQFIPVQLLSHVQHFATPWTAACQASLAFTITQLAQTYVHWVSDAIQPSCPLLPLSPPAFNLSQDQAFSSESALCIRWPVVLQYLTIWVRPPRAGSVVFSCKLKSVFQLCCWFGP